MDDSQVLNQLKKWLEDQKEQQRILANTVGIYEALPITARIHLTRLQDYDTVLAKLNKLQGTTNA